MELIEQTLDNVGFDGRHAKVTIPWASIPKGVTRLVGPNGTGKSTVAGLIPGTLFGTHPDYGDTADLVPYGETGTATLTVSHGGHTYRVTDTLKSTVTGKGVEKRSHAPEIWRDDETAPLASGVKAVAAEVESIFGPMGEWLMTFYQRQKTGQGRAKAVKTATEADPREREAFVERCLRITVYRQHIDACHARFRTAEETVERLRPDYERLQRLRDRVASLVTQQAESAGIVGERITALDLERAGLALAESAVRAIDERAALHRQTAERRAALTAEKDRRASIVQQIAGLRTAVAEASAIQRTAEDALDQARARVATARAASDDVALAADNRAAAERVLRQAEQRHESATAALTAAKARLSQAERAQQTASDEVARLTAALASSQEIECATLAAYEQTATAARERAEAAEKRREALLDEHRQASAVKDTATAEARQAAATAATAVNALANGWHAKATAEQSALDLAGRIARAEADAARVLAMPFGERCAESGCEFVRAAAESRAGLPQLRADAETARATVERLTAELVDREAAAAQMKREAAAIEERATKEAATVAGIIARGVAARDEAAAARREAESAESSLTTARESIDRSRRQMEVQLADAKTAAAPGAIEEMCGTVARLGEDVTAAVRDVAEARASVAALPAVDAESAAALTVAEYGERVAKAALTAATERMNAALHREATATGALAQMREDTAIDADLDALPVVEAVTEAERAEAVEALGLARGAVALAAEDVEIAKRTNAEIAGALRNVHDDIAALEPCAGELRAAELAAVRWKALCNRIKALVSHKIRASAGRITNRVNELLKDVWSGRFQIDFEPLTQNRSNDNYTATYTIWVDDLEWGQRREFDQFSGGQQNPVGIALRFGLVMFYNEQAAHPCRTIVLDEIDAPLDATAKIEFQQMLRHFADIGGMDRIIVMSHTEGFDVDAEVDVRDYMTLANVAEIDDAPKKRKARKAAVVADVAAEAEPAVLSAGNQQGLPF